ncbi:MAG: hypothetical protein IGR93_11455 [Hydrococcus sp. C42_A2020_068]|nr:hypothetical protein [Hydrococcus sp. C42_A2020_068]
MVNHGGNKSFFPSDRVTEHFRFRRRFYERRLVNAGIEKQNSYGYLDNGIISHFLNDMLNSSKITVAAIAQNLRLLFTIFNRLSHKV